MEIQKEELSSLESIYNEEEFSYSLENDVYEVTVKIFITIPENYYFTYKDSRVVDSKLEKVLVSHLPPLILVVQLPPDYPATSPPKFTIRSSWLHRSLLSKLCRKLDQLWEENKGQEILFSWIGFLQFETLEYLNIQKSIKIDYLYKIFNKVHQNSEKLLKTKSLEQVLELKGTASHSDEQSHKVRSKRAYNARKKNFRERNLFDERAISDILVEKNPVQMLIDYNKMRSQIEFMKNCFVCMICFSDKSGRHCTQFSPCAHVFCKDCITSYINVKIKDGSVQNIMCPDIDCKSEASPGQIKDLLTPEQFLRYDSLLLNSTLDKMTDIIYCPRKSCQYPVSREADEVMANCPVCQYVFCIFCKMTYHGIEPCKVNTEEKQKLVHQYVEASDDQKKELEMRYGKKQLQILVENSMSEDWISSNSQTCPNCSAAIEKSDGCNKMTCWKCGTFFCWVCGTKLNKECPYDHYRDRASACFNKLYLGAIPDEDEDEEEFFGDYLEESSDEDEFHYQFV